MGSSLLSPLEAKDFPFGYKPRYVRAGPDRHETRSPAPTPLPEGGWPSPSNALPCWQFSLLPRVNSYP